MIADWLHDWNFQFENFINLIASLTSIIFDRTSMTSVYQKRFCSLNVQIGWSNGRWNLIKSKQFRSLVWSGCRRTLKRLKEKRGRFSACAKTFRFKLASFIIKTVSVDRNKLLRTDLEILSLPKIIEVRFHNFESFSPFSFRCPLERLLRTWR